jgi:hypothetical protein
VATDSPAKNNFQSLSSAVSSASRELLKAALGKTICKKSALNRAF